MVLEVSDTLTQEITDRAEIRVLLVEDDMDAAELDRILLSENEDNEFNVDWCPNLTTALIKLAEPDRYDIVLLDLGLPELNGYKSLRVLQSVTAKPIPVVILTSDESKLTKDLTIGYGSSRSTAAPQVVAYLTKGEISGAQLRRTLRDALAP